MRGSSDDLLMTHTTGQCLEEPSCETKATRSQSAPVRSQEAFPFSDVFFNLFSVFFFY